MHIDDFLRMLKNVSRKPDAQGNYLCKCPAHDDSTASLHVKLGQNKKGQDIILIKCFAGCTREAILSSMGLRDRDLTVNPVDDRPPWEEPAKKASRQPAPRPKAQTPAANPQASADLPKKQEHGRKTVECTYQYVGESGQLLYESVRYRFEDGKKTFNQRRPDPEHPGQWLYNMGNVPLVLYRLPEVTAAIGQGCPVWVAEGEKDADSLCKMGLCGTTAPMGAGKWNKPQYAEALRGADVYILPDNDEPGWNHAKDVGRSLDGVAKSCRILDLRRIWADMPQKADVSDLMAIHGAEKTREMLEELSVMQFAELSDMPGLYARIGGYGVQWNSICKMNADGDYKRLCNFVAVPVTMVTRDDGLTIKTVIEIKGWGINGKALPTVSVESDKFTSMNWVPDKWSLRASIMPGNTVKDQLRYAIAEAGRMTAVHETEYLHTGWRQIDGKWVYLHGNGGAVGVETVRSSLPKSLARYGLDKREKWDKVNGFMVGLQMTEVIKKHIAIPLLSMAYLAPLCELLRKKQCAPKFALFLYGVTGTRKSTATALCMSHFGDFAGDNPPATFRDTGNSAREKAFTLKDSILWVDDYHPTESQQERRRMDAMAQDLARAFGDHAERGRLNADRTLQEARPPRSLCIITGEDLPAIGASGLARFFIVDVHHDDVPIGPELTALQQAVHGGALQSSMAGYIANIAGNMDKMADVLQEEYLQLRSEAAQRMKGVGHGRSAEALAHLMLGWKMMISWGKHLGVIDDALGERMEAEGWQAMTRESVLHAKEAREDAPEERYISCIAEMLSSKQCYVIDLTSAERASTEKPGLIGWADKHYYMLLPDSVYQAVSVLFQRQGRTFPVSPRAIHRMLKEKGLVVPEGDSPTKHKWIGGRSVRLLFVPRHLIDGGEPPTQQTSAFTPVDEPWPGEERK